MFRFTIRDLLWLTVVVAIGVYWWSDHRRVDIEANRWKRVTAAYESKLKDLDDLNRQRSELEQLREEIQNPGQVMPLDEVPPNVMQAAQDKRPDMDIDVVLKSQRGFYDVRGKNKAGRVYRIRVSESGEIFAVDWSD